MSLLVAFASLLVCSVLVSERLHRSVLSTALVFLVGGFCLGPGVLGAFSLPSGIVLPIAEVALYTSLFTDGMHAPAPLLRSAWRLPGRALLIGMPITFVGGSVLAYMLLGLSWTESFLVGAVLTPTDPVFAQAIVGRANVPERLSHLLNVESGLNDGLALPVVLILLSTVSTSHSSIGHVVFELALGAALGVAVPYVIARLERLTALGAGGHYKQLYGFAIGLLLFGLCKVTGANVFIAAFVGGSALATASQHTTEAFSRLGDALSEVSKLAAIFVFSALITPQLLGRISIGAWVWAVLLLVLVRPVSLAVALLGERLDRKEWLSAAWFGPKGFASVTYGLLVLRSSAVHASRMFDLIAVVVAISIVAHSTTDTVVARAFEADA